VGAARFFCRPGFLGANSMIHFARWLVLPGTNQLVFLSNYDGTWQGYVGDFVTNTAGAKGVTSIWSNCVGFPRTRDLFDEGAADRDRLVRWARCQQREVCFWYSGYRTITTDQVRTHAAIRQGIALAASAQQAEDWLACFGSAPRPATELQFDEIPAIAFGGLPRLPEALAAGFCLSTNKAMARRWLRSLQDQVSYGEQPQRSQALVLGLSAAALRSLGVDDDSIATFPVAFQRGMDAPERSWANGDRDGQHPAAWQWGNANLPADVWLVLYDRRVSSLVARFAAIKKDATTHGHALVCSIDLPWAMAHRAGPPGVKAAGVSGPIPQTFEPFGFADGISQPAIRGTRRAHGPHEDVLPAGEFVLGYPDLLDRVVPSPTIGMASDPANRLYTCPLEPDRQRPDFTHDAREPRRDLGRNGTFLVVRQLEQDVARFDRWLTQAASRLAPVAGLAPGVTKQDWLAAKVIGRWRDGTPLALHPHGPVGGVPENGFRYAEFDGSGAKCPIGSHIRRANPRDGAITPSREASRAAQMHRMIRVGRPYRSAQGVGTLFMCVVADIERQFEFVQQRWLLNPAFNGLPQETDPLVGTNPQGRRFSIPGSQGCVVDGLQDFVKMLGGGYYFVPSRSALSVLVAG
jgi:Dyp-type peroxidase family